MREKGVFKSLLDNLVCRFKIKILPYLKWYIFGFIFIISVASFFIPADIFSRQLKVYFLDVGQGDAVLIRTPSHQTVLIDGGPDNSVIYKLGKYLPFWERKIDLIILTHPHADHLTGLIEVLKRYKVERIVFTGVSYYSDFYKEFKKLREEKQIPFTLAIAGREFDFGGEPPLTPPISPEASEQGQPPLTPPISPRAKQGEREGVKIKILSPRDNLWNKVFYGNENDGGGLNDTSVVAQLSFGKNSFLFMGDAGVEVEKEILKFQAPNSKFCPFGTSPAGRQTNPNNPNPTTNNYQLTSNILKIGHHGSDTASGYEFLKSVSPNLAIISVGKNKYSLPTYRTLYRLRQLGIPTFRTDEKGDIKARCSLEMCRIE